MEVTTIKIDHIPAVLYGASSDRVYLFVHGKNGYKEEAAGFAGAACARGWQVISVDLPEHGERRQENECFDPWHAVPELKKVMHYIRQRWSRVRLRANSLGAWFSMLSCKEEPLEKCLFVSPVLDMEQLIRDMMTWASVTEDELEQKKTIPTEFGETLSWEYLLYAKEHRITGWDIPTEILYAGRDNLTGRSTVDAFVETSGAGLTVMENGEHWFHTPEQLGVLSHWEKEMM